MNLIVVTHVVVRGNGQGIVNYQVVKKALKNGHSVTVLASDMDAELLINKNLTWVKISVDGWKTGFIRNQVFAAKTAKWLSKNKKPHDIVVVNGFITWAKSEVNCVHFVHSAWLASPTNKVKFNLRGMYSRFYTSINSVLERYAFKRSDIVVAVSETIKIELLEIGVTKEKIVVINNGVDLESFYPSGNKRTELGLREGRLTGLFAGDIQSDRKGLDVILKAIESIPELDLAVAGSVKNSNFPKMARELGIEERVHFLGYRKDLNRLMNASDFFIFPSRYEPFGLVILEAMASGLPVITSKNVGASYLVKSMDYPDAGFVMNHPESIVELKDILAYVINNPEERKRLGENARKTAETNSWSAMAEQYVETFKSLDGDFKLQQVK